MTSLYDRYFLPRITDFLCAAGPNGRQREKVIPLATGSVLEIGVGTGLNFQYYNPEQVSEVMALDPSEEMWSIANKRLAKLDFPVRYVKGRAENIPVDTNAIDSIVITYTLCTIPNYIAAFSEFRRVIKPTGAIIFTEHGTAPDKSVRRWQNTLNPIWRRLGGGCNLNRNIPTMIKNGGFVVEQLESMYIPGFKPASYNYWGVANPK
ncbi:MAG: class I SAM-dependent methyltransferase [Saprospiraceae bacterium]|nr:class I SAM-dependent methyltransferase [Saprospiraceae bacterium]